MKTSVHKWFLLTALTLLVVGLCFGVLASLVYLYPEFLKNTLGFTSLRPMHVSSVIFWILLGASGCVYSGLEILSGKNTNNWLSRLQLSLWIIAIIGIFYSYTSQKFGGREYWEFEPVWALPIALAWIVFIINFTRISKSIRSWPVYLWMWLTGCLFFLFTFAENYLWIIPYFRENFIRDMTIQWKVNGSLVGAWNQLIYGTAFFLMDRIEKNNSTGRSKMAFTMYFLGLTNLMFNWGHHVYTLPTEKYVHYFGYAVSMTEWIFFINIIYTWKKSITTTQVHYHYFPYRFLMAADIWVFLNLLQAILMSVPAINRITHGTHITVAHAMGTTIGINSMILLSACFEFLGIQNRINKTWKKVLNICFWSLQLCLLCFWLTLNMAGIQKGLWQLSSPQSSYSLMMKNLHPYFVVFFISGLGLCLFFSVIAVFLMRKTRFRDNKLTDKGLGLNGTL
jgi:nitric oxide reductase subunit B